MDEFCPARWLKNAHLQTIYAATLAPRPQVRLRRVRWETPDGDFIDLDWLADPAGSTPPVPLVVLFHGLEGASDSHYANALMHFARERGYNAVVVHFRGCSGEPNRLARAYHCGDAEEIRWVLERLRHTSRGAPIVAAGVSLGGNALLKYLGEAGSQALQLIAAACAISAPLDLVAAGNTLDRGFNRVVYVRSFLRSLKRKSLAKLKRFPHLYEAHRVRRARTLREFDDIVTAPLHGFLDAEDYWTRASSKRWLRSVRVPTLVINARDDPFLPARYLPVIAEVSDAVTLEFPAHGGHAAFVSGPFPGTIDWLPRRTLGFFASVLAVR
jgi:predicted alpha/beta-fold hydrolase